MKIVRKILIQASPDDVFAVITDFSGYARWNPWIVRAQGSCVVGGNVLVDAWVGGRLQQYRHKIVQVQKPELFHWCDVGWFTVLVDGERIRTLAAHEQGTEYTVELNISGPLQWLAKWLFAASLDEGMTKETQALKAWVEKQVRA